MNLHLPIKTIRNRNLKLEQRKRGSTVLLVLAMLTVLLLLGIAFSYSTRLESQASSNYAELAQARTSAASGLPMVLPMLLQASKGLTSTLQDWNTVPQNLQKMVKANGKTSQVSASELAAIRRAGVNASQNKDGKLQEAPQANVQIRDLSGLVNLNAVPDQTAMERVVSAVLPGGNSKAKSTALMALRGDYMKSLTQRAAAPRDTKNANIDLRDPSVQVLDSLQRLQFGEQVGRAAFTDKEIEKLSGFVTVFSQAPEVFNGPDKVHTPRIPLDAIEPKRVYEVLRTAFPDKKSELLLQFAANLTDFSDTDSEPTVLDANGNVVAETGTPGVVGSSNVTIGVEMTPFISEVYPDAATSVGFDDDGQFVEIVNPWNKSISLSGWTLRTAEGASIALSATLPAGGYLLITDNYDAPKQDTPPGHGSIVSLFGSTANGGTKQVQNDPSLSLTDRNSKVSLYDATGKLADVFAYGSTGQVDGKSSFQRTDPMVRGSSKAEATPFGAAVASAANSQMISAATKAWEDGNSTMTKLSQLFNISTGFAEKNAEMTDAGVAGKVHGGQLAELKAPEQTPQNTAGADPYPDNMDLRLIDVFTASSLDIPDFDKDDDDDVASENGADAYKAFRDKMQRLNDRARKADGDPENETTVTTAFSYGKLNLNTCSKFGLLGLNLDAVTGSTGAAGLVEQFEGHRLTQIRQGKAPFPNLSDFVVKFVTNLSRQNLDVLDTVTDQVAVGSSAFEITSTNRLSPKQQEALDSKDGSNGSRPATATAKWVISMDQQPYSVVGFTLIP